MNGENNNNLNFKGLTFPDLKINYESLYDRVFKTSVKLSETGVGTPLLEIVEDQNKSLKEVGEYLKTLVELNGNISDYNRQLVSLNERILKKINTLDDTLEFINNTLTDKAENDKAQSNTRNALLLELITIMDSKDEGKLQKFFKDVPVSMGVSLLTQYLIYKLGLS